jgi:hypothetical protein
MCPLFFETLSEPNGPNYSNTHGFRLFPPITARKETWLRIPKCRISRFGLKETVRNFRQFISALRKLFLVLNIHLQVLVSREFAYLERISSSKVSVE